MRLIDADELKEKLSGEWFVEPNASIFNEVFSLIDNAPTVEYPFYQEAYQTGCEEGKNERPQGKWIRTGQSFVNPNKFRNFCCSNCFCELDEHIRHEPIFCPNCGAEMQKGGAE